MSIGKTLFTRLMESIPRQILHRIVDRHGVNRRLKFMVCIDQFRAMTFAQLISGQSLRDIETCLSANQARLYGMDFRAPIRHSTLTDANEGHDWRIWANFTV